MSFKSLIDVPDLSKNIKEKINKETSVDRFLSHRLYLGRMGGRSLHALKSDLISCMWEYKPYIIFWNSLGFESILSNYDKCEHFLPHFLREQNFFKFLEEKSKNKAEKYIVVIDSPLEFNNYKGLFEVINSSSKNIFFWVNTTKIHKEIPTNLFFINAFKNFYEEELERLLPNHKCSRISFSADDIGKCFTSENNFKIYDNFSSEETLDIINTLRWYNDK